MNIFITGATAGGDDTVALYERLVDVAKRYFSAVSSPLDAIAFKGTDKERYERAMRLIGEADLVVAEGSLPSTGQGIELQEAVRRGVPIVVTHHDSARPSGMLLGLPIEHRVTYSDIASAVDQLDKYLRDRQAQ